MIVVRDVIQGTPEWLKLRMGIPTASRFNRIVTPKEHKFSKAAESFLIELATERMVGEPLTTDKGEWMERGTETEAMARRWYEFYREVEVEQVGFCFTDDKKAGCSPDGLVDEDGGLEMKCPSAHVHIGHLIGKSDPATDTQIQGGLYVTGRKWWDVVSFCPGLPPVLIRYQRDEHLIGLLDAALLKFNTALDVAMRKLEGLRLGRIEGFGEPDTLLQQLYDSVAEVSAEE